MILSNNARTYIHIAIYYYAYRNKKYMYRWAGPSSAHTYKLRSDLWMKNDI